jgi:phage N-6-adenine-methyltransferase
MDYEESTSTTLTIYKDSWGTPKPVYDYWNKKYNFVADVAASKENALNKNYFTKEQNALIMPWHIFRTNPYYYVWCNPPYSDVTPWIRKATHAQRLGVGTVMLLPNQTSTAWFKEGLASCDEFFIVTKGRLSFIDAYTGKPDGTPRLGSVFFIWNTEATHKLKVKTIDRDTLMNGDQIINLPKSS